LFTAIAVLSGAPGSVPRSVTRYPAASRVGAADAGADVTAASPATAAVTAEMTATPLHLTQFMMFPLRFTRRHDGRRRPVRS
jgi:hypothetical protein